MLMRTSITVCLMSSFAINTLEDMRARLAFLCSKPQQFQLIIFFAVLCLLSIMLGIVRSIAFDTSRHVKSTTKCCMAPFPTVLTLWNSRVHVHTMNSSNILSNIKMLIDNRFGYSSILWIPDINPNDHYVWFGGCFNNMRFWY